MAVSSTAPAPTAPTTPVPQSPPPSPSAPAPVPAGPPAPAGLKMHWDAPPAMALKPGISYQAQLATTDGKIGVQLVAGAAPNAVNNFVFLAKQGFYKNVPIHRMIPDFMFQSGDPTGTGTGGPGYDIPDDKVPANWKYTKGVLAMANTGQPNTGGSQFFIMLGNEPLPPTYTIFGYVNAGRDVLDKINARKVGPNDMGEPSKPLEPISISDVTISESPIAPAADAAGA